MKFNIDDVTMGKIKVISAITGGILAALYVAFLVFPVFIDLNKYMPLVSSEVEKLSGLKIEAKNPELRTTFRLGVKIKADNFNINYKDNSPLLSLKKPEAEVNLPSILIGHINLDKIATEELDAYLVFTKDKKYTLEEYILKAIENAAPDKEAEKSADDNKSFNFPIEIRNINIKAGKIALHLKDEIAGKTYLAQLNNSEFLMKSLNGPLAFKTTGFIGIEDSNVRFVNADINFKTKLPKLEETQNEGIKKEDETQTFEFNFNPFKALEDFNFRTDIFADLDIKNIEDFRAKGTVDVQKFSLKLSNVQLPDSHAKINFNNRDIDLESKVFVSKDEFIQAKSNIKTGKNSKLGLNIKTDKITLNSLKNILGAILDICCIENDMASMSAKGYITSNFNLDTNFKTITSNGEIRLIDGDIRYPKAGLVISAIKAFLDFSENALNIKDTGALVNGAKFDVKGEIASNANINLTVKSDPLKIKDLVNIATEFKLVNKKDIADFEFNDGVLTLLINVLGDFQNIQPKADINLNNFKMLVRSAKTNLNIDNVNVSARPKNNNDVDALIKVRNFQAAVKEPRLTFNMPSAEVAADMQNITLKPLNATLEGTKINVSGDINNYMKNPELNIKITGNVHPNTVFAFIPKEFRNGITYRGAMPYNALITGGLENIKITGGLTSDPANHISIVEIPALKGKNNILAFDTALKNDVFELNDVCVKSAGEKFATLKGSVKNIYAPEPVLSGINISIPNKTNIVVLPLGNASFNASGSLNLNGRAFAPDMTGSINIDTFKYPDFGLTLEDLVLNFNKNILNIKANNAKVANSDFSGDAAVSTNFLKGVVINNLNYNSNYIDSDALIQLADKIAKTMPAAPASAPSSSTSGGSADLGIVLNGGQAKIGKLKSGTLNIENISYNHTLSGNVYNLNDLTAVFAQGTASGKCSYNIMNGKIAVNMKAENIAMRDAAKAFTGVDLVRSGTLEGAAKLTLSGATYIEQIKSLNGTISFSVKDGEYGENISFGRFINAANVLSLGAFASQLNGITSKINSFNTQEFKNINGVLTFNKGTAGVSSFKSQGPNMSLYANGSYNLLNNNANLKITGKVSSKVAGVLGNLGINKMQTTVEKVTAAAENAINKAADALNAKYADNKAVQTGLAILGTIKNSAAGTSGTSSNTAAGATAGQTAGQIVTRTVKEKLNPIFGAIPANDIANIPPLSVTDTGETKNFQVTINGPIASPKSVKSFKFQNDGSTAAAQ